MEYLNDHLSKTALNYVFYDLETNGLDYYTTGIMQISLINIDGTVLLNQYVYPFDNRIDGTHIHGIDLEKLRENNAISTQNLCELMKDILRKKFGRDDVYLIAYNNFGYDQIILENNFKTVNIKMPSNWYFVDLFPLLKELYPSIKPNFKLATVFEQLCGHDDSINFHCALADSTCMYKIFESKKSEIIPLLNKYTRSSLFNPKILDSPISSLGGYSSGMKLEHKNIKTIGHLYQIYYGYGYNEDALIFYLKDKLGIYSNFYANNMIKQLNVIRKSRDF